MKMLRDNSLTIALAALFLASILGHLLTGWHVASEDAIRHGQGPISLVDYTTSAQFLSTVFENWESEFLQMATYVVLTAMLFQRGSAESKDPDTPPRDINLRRQAADPASPRILRLGPVWRALYARSLGLALTLLFLASFALHLVHSAHLAGEEALQHGDQPPTLLAHLGTAQFWFESFQNWQSEFLSTAVLVVLSIFLRQRESPESKPVSAPHASTGA